MMATFLVIIALSGITETVTGGKCPNVSSGSSCGVFRICPHPHSDEWNCLKSTMNCYENNGQYYHCAKDVNGCYVQHCAKRVYCNSGQQPVLNLTEDTAMCHTCPAEEYQRRRFWSNEQRECDYAKTKCDGKGEIECHPGTPTEDRTCRCDIHKKFALQGYAYNKRTCCSKDYDQECYCISFKDQCPPGTVRHYNYMCLPECQQGFYRQMDSEDCLAENSFSQTNVTSTGQTPLQDPQVPTGIIIGSIVPTVLVIAALILIYCLKCKQPRGQNSASVLIYCLKCRQQRGQIPGEIKVPNEGINYPEVHRDPSEMVPFLPQNGLSGNRRKKKEKKDAGIRQIIRINAPGALINFGDKNNVEASPVKPKSQEEDVSMNPEESRPEESIQTDETSMDTEPKKPVENEDIHPESRPEESIQNDETSMDTKPKKPVENEDIHPDETRVKYVPYPPQDEADDQTERKEVWSESLVPDDQTERKKVWSELVVPDDQTKKKEVWSEAVVPNDQTKRKEVWSELVVPDDQTKKKEVWTEAVVPNDQTKKKEPQIPGSNAEKRQKTEMFQSSGGSMSSMETDIKTKRSI